MPQILSSSGAFCLGFTTGSRAGRFVSAREALAEHPGLLDSSNLDEFLNGVHDGVRGDSWRYEFCLSRQAAGTGGSRRVGAGLFGKLQLCVIDHTVDGSDGIPTAYAGTSP